MPFPNRKEVQVSCRFRSVDEKQPNYQSGKASCVKYPEANCLEIVTPSNSTSKSFVATFDHVFQEDATQEQVYMHIGKPCVDDVLAGYNYTILAYGQTGSGIWNYWQTHTILGDNTNQGIVPRVTKNLFDKLKQFEGPENQTEITVNIFEVYQEKFRDLLMPKNSNLRIRECKSKGIWVEGAAEYLTTDFKCTMNIIEKAISNRSKGTHLMNLSSSRSHCIVLLTVSQNDVDAGVKKIGKLFLVDLAGSEMVRKTAASGKRLEEAKYINKSLTALGMVINALTDEKCTHIPYRDSKLTRILQNSLGGNGKMHLILTCSNSVYNLDETLSTIRFGSRARSIKNKPRINTERSLLQYQQLVSNMEKRLCHLNLYINSLEKSTVCKNCSNKSSPFIRDEPDANDCSDDDHVAGHSCFKCKTSDISIDNKLFLCDGNCGHYYHTNCVQIENNNDSHDGEWYCEFCSRSQNSSSNTQDPTQLFNNDKEFNQQIYALTIALKSMRLERDKFEQQYTIEKDVSKSSDDKKSEYHRMLEKKIDEKEAIIGELKNSMTTLTEENNLLRDNIKVASTINEELRSKEVLLLQELDDERKGKEAENEILRRSLLSFEKKNESLTRELSIMEDKLSKSEIQLKSYYEQISQLQMKLSLKNEKPTLNKLQIRKPGERPITSQTCLRRDIERNQQTSKPNIQYWWSGEESPAKVPLEPSEKYLCKITSTNNSAWNSNSTDGSAVMDDVNHSQPFKSRLIGLLNSLQEETDSFKDLGEQMARESSNFREKSKRPSTRQNGKNTSILPDVK